MPEREDFKKNVKRFKIQLERYLIIAQIVIHLR